MEPRFHQSKATQKLEAVSNTRQEALDQEFEHQANLLVRTPGIFTGDCGEPWAAAVVLTVSSPLHCPVCATVPARILTLLEFL